MTGTLLALAAIFAQLSLVAVGGGNTILPEMQRQVVSVHRWMTGAEFAALFALALAAPGPNMLVSTLLGWRVAGLPGALVATLSLTGPSSVLTFATASLWHRFRDKPWRRTVQRGLVPVTVGLVMAASVLLTEATSETLARLAITATTVAVLTLTKLHPLVPLAAAAALGALGLAG